MSNLKNVDDASFKGEVLDHKGLTLVDFWATWCGPCRALAPTLESIATEKDDVKIVKVNVDENPTVSASYRVTNLPYMALFKDGELVDSLLGNQPRTKIVQLIDSHL